MKYTHIISINLLVKTDSEARPSDSEIKDALDKFILENSTDLTGATEWVDTEVEE